MFILFGILYKFGVWFGSLSKLKVKDLSEDGTLFFHEKNNCLWIFISIEKIYPFGYKNSQRMDINIQIWDKSQKKLKNTIYQKFLYPFKWIKFFHFGYKIQNMDNIP